MLLPQAHSLTALNAAPEMLRRARDRMRGTATRFIEADIFEWVAHSGAGRALPTSEDHHLGQP
ncbi:hypothetical protein AB0G97_02550 [Streptomyces sp. NPDC020755]|uniref:hypothetical protein n=1 Tax=unclassified Streptomyces TaxID=2593676 RepID=UPI002F40BCCC